MTDKCGSVRVCVGTCSGQQASELGPKEMAWAVYFDIMAARNILIQCEGLPDECSNSLNGTAAALNAAALAIWDVLRVVDPAGAPF